MPDNPLFDYPSTSIDETVMAELLAARAEFLALLASLSDRDLERKSVASVWTLKEVMVHVVFWLQQTPRVIARARVGKSPPHIPRQIFDWINIWLTRRAARRQDRASIIERYEQAFQAVTQLVEDIPAQEWQRGAAFGAPFYEYRTVEKILLSHRTHVQEHMAEIRASL